jgi:hypothetical protein
MAPALLLLLLLLLAPCCSTLPPPPTFPATPTYALSSPRVTEGSLAWPPPTSGAARIAPANFSVHPALLTRTEVAAILALVSPLALDQDQDTVDSLATHEVYLERSGTLEGIAGIAGKPDAQPAVFERRLPARRSLAELTAPIVEERILPLVNARLARACAAGGVPGRCRVCHSRVRRYTQGERTEHPTHFDIQALVTVVIPLSDFGVDFEGGLYVSTGAGYRGEEAFLPLAAGDAVVHQSTLLHGVRLERGTRWSWVLWLKNAASGEACEGVRAEEWTREEAEAGDPLAMFLHARRQGSAERRRHWLQRAALAGFPRAASEYGQALVEGGGREGAAEGRAWLEAAAREGEPEGLYNLGLLEVGPRGNVTRAAALFCEAAARRLAPAAANCAVAHYNGRGVGTDGAAALAWFSRAGDERSLLLAARIAEAGAPPQLQASPQAALRLLQRAAAGGSREAAEQVAAWRRRHAALDDDAQGVAEDL